MDHFDLVVSMVLFSMIFDWLSNKSWQSWLEGEKTLDQRPMNVAVWRLSDVGPPPDAGKVPLATEYLTNSQWPSVSPSEKL